MANLIERSWTIQGTDGAALRISETRDRFEVVIAIKRDGLTSTVRLNWSQWDALRPITNGYGRGDGPEVNEPPPSIEAREETAACAESRDGDLKG